MKYIETADFYIAEDLSEICPKVNTGRSSQIASKIDSEEYDSIPYDADDHYSEHLEAIVSECMGCHENQWIQAFINDAMGDSTLKDSLVSYRNKVLANITKP